MTKKPTKTAENFLLENARLLGHPGLVMEADGSVREGFGGLERAIPEGTSREEALATILADAEDRREVLAYLCAAPAEVEARVLRQIRLGFGRGALRTADIVLTPLSGGAVLLQVNDAADARRTRDQYEEIFDSTSDGLFVIDANRKVRLFNKACGHLTGRPVEEVLRMGCECSEVIQCHTEEGESFAHSLCPARDVFRGDETHQCEEMLLTNADGEERWVETTYSAIRRGDGKVDYVVGSLRDVHDRKLLEERLHQTEKLASLGQLVAGIAHEIKNPLAILHSSLDIVGNPERPGEQRAEAIDFMREEIRRLDHRVRAFLAFARPRDLEPRAMVLSGMVERRLPALEAVFPCLEICHEVTRPQPIVMADEEQLGQVLLNLVLNAGEALGSQGRITIRTRQQGQAAVLEVEDNGPGIPRELAGRIFDPFFTTKTEGTGLGLSICYQIVLAHHGNLSVSKGEGGRGTCFSVRLPISARFEAPVPVG